MTLKERERQKALEHVIQQIVTYAAAAAKLGLSERQLPDRPDSRTDIEQSHQRDVPCRRKHPKKFAARSWEFTTPTRQIYPRLPTCRPLFEVRNTLR